MSTFQLVLFCCIYALTLSSDVSINLKFIIPGSNELISTKLSMESHQDVTYYKIIRSVLYINNIIMDCSFTFETSNFNTNNPLICDINNACISPSDSDQLFSTKLHLENLGIGDLEITEIKKINTKNSEEIILFYDHLICIGDSNKCDGHRYIDFISNPESEILTISPINSQIHNKLRCNAKETIYHQKQRQKQQQKGGSGRKLLAINNNNKRQNMIYHHNNYMDIILTIILLIMIVISIFNMSYAFDQIKDNDASKVQSFDTRRV